MLHVIRMAFLKCIFGIAHYYSQPGFATNVSMTMSHCYITMETLSGYETLQRSQFAAR